MELQYNNLEFNEEEINVLVKRLNEFHKSQQSDFANLCYTVFKIESWFRGLKILFFLIKL